MRAAAAHARNTRHGTTRAPRLGRRLVAGLALDGVRLTSVHAHLQHVNVARVTSDAGTWS